MPVLEGPRRTPRFVAGMIAAAVVGALVASLIASRWAMPGDDSAEAGFARDMATHHAQAVEMSMIVHEKSDDPQVVYLASDIALTQHGQIGYMQAWLRDWHLSPTGSKPAMAWMPRQPPPRNSEPAACVRRMPFSSWSKASSAAPSPERSGRPGAIRWPLPISECPSQSVSTA